MLTNAKPESNNTFIEAIHRHKGAETIYCYTRAEALEAGVLVNVTEQAEKAGIPLPVDITEDVYFNYIQWDESDSNRKQCNQTTEERLSHMLKTLKKAFMNHFGPTTNNLIFELRIIPRAGRGSVPRRTKLEAALAVGDYQEAVITIKKPSFPPLD